MKKYLSFVVRQEESILYPTFYVIPLKNSRYVINKNGVIINELTGKILTNGTDVNGYNTVSIGHGFPKKHHHYKLHRLVALLFVSKPERHFDKDFSELQVNHKDGVKTNNTYDNLEWVTQLENIIHARENNLYHNDIGVVAKEVKTGIITKFKSVQNCADWLCLDHQVLLRHLYSVCAGLIERNGHIFKFDNETVWPEMVDYDRENTTLNIIAYVMAENLSTGKKMIFPNLSVASEYLGYDPQAIRLHRYRKGYDMPYDGWIFYKYDPSGKKDYDFRPNRKNRTQG